MMRQYQLYYKQTLVCETTSEYELHQCFLEHYRETVWKPNNQKVGNRRIVTFPNYAPAELIDMLYTNKLTNYQLNFRTKHLKNTQFELRGIGLKEFIQKYKENQ